MYCLPLPIMPLKKIECEEHDMNIEDSYDMGLKAPSEICGIYLAPFNYVNRFHLSIYYFYICKILQEVTD